MASIVATLFERSLLPETYDYCESIETIKKQDIYVEGKYELGFETVTIGKFRETVFYSDYELIDIVGAWSVAILSVVKPENSLKFKNMCEITINALKALKN